MKLTNLLLATIIATPAMADQITMSCPARPDRILDLCKQDSHIGESACYMTHSPNLQNYLRIDWPDSSSGRVPTWYTQTEVSDEVALDSSISAISAPVSASLSLKDNRPECLYTFTYTTTNKPTPENTDVDVILTWKNSVQNCTVSKDNKSFTCEQD